MSFALSGVVPWGRSFDEYVSMFALSERDLRGRILGCSDGPASFNATASQRGCRVVSVDPIYSHSADQIRRRVEETAPTIAAQIHRNPDEFVWRHFRNASHLVDARLSAMGMFLEDFAHSSGRYVAGGLPDVPFAADGFDLALCSHFLFLYSAHQNLEFHLASIRDLVRVAREVRIFPLLELGSVESRHLAGAIDDLTASGLHVARVRVEYEVQRGGNEMLVLRR